MLFSSLIFLWIFLPIVFVATRVIKDTKISNIFLLIASLIFYSWGEPFYVLLMVFSVIVNYFCGIGVLKMNSDRNARILLAICIIINIGLLGCFKYYNFFVDTVNDILPMVALENRVIPLPIGISFYTFQALSYVIDVYRKKVEVQTNAIKMALYICLFPQLMAGPIVRYKDISSQLEARILSTSKTAEGLTRFSYGLAKKVLIANTMGSIADQFFDVLPADQLTTAMAWVGIICYTLQIYYDFSGYSDMAIGLGKMLGFDFLENFNFPYISASIKEFWRRWHISLSTWFREYLYIPLGGNQKGRIRTYINLYIVFFATGLWHGASWSFVAWGLFHGTFLVIERLFLGAWLQKNPIKFVNHIYTMLVVIVGWVFFRAWSLTGAFSYLKIMFLPTQTTHSFGLFYYVNPFVLTMLFFAIALCGFLRPFAEKYADNNRFVNVRHVIAIVLFAFSVIWLAADTYNPFIYFRF